MPEWSKASTTLRLYFLVLVLDIGSSIVLYEHLHGWTPEWSDFWNQITQFGTDAADFILLTVFRALAVTIIGLVAIYIGLPNFDAIQRQRDLAAQQPFKQHRHH